MTHVALEELHVDQFRDCLNSDFQVVDDPPVDLALRLAEVHDRSKSPQQEVFALLFHGPAQYFMPQGMYQLKHSGLGEIELFLVPVDQDSQGFQYEAVFNRFISSNNREV